MEIKDLLNVVGDSSSIVELKRALLSDKNRAIKVDGVCASYIPLVLCKLYEDYSELIRESPEDWNITKEFTKQQKQYLEERKNLLNIIDKTISPMGGRLLKRWLALPLKNVDKIKQRHEVVHFLTKESRIFRF